MSRPDTPRQLFDPEKDYAHKPEGVECPKCEGEGCELCDGYGVVEQEQAEEWQEAQREGIKWDRYAELLGDVAEEQFRALRMKEDEP